jgi:hypothetical protein
MVLKWPKSCDIMTPPEHMGSHKVALFSNTGYNDGNPPKTLVQNQFESLAYAVLYTALPPTHYQFRQEHHCTSLSSIPSLKIFAKEETCKLLAKIRMLKFIQLSYKVYIQ